MSNRGRQFASKLFALMRPGALRLQWARCPICGPTLGIKLSEKSIAVRCFRCRASAIHISIVEVLRQLYPDIGHLAAYELSSRGPLHDYLSRHVKQLTYSEFFDDVTPGEYLENVQCQDVQHLTYADHSFDLCTSTEVFEHVPDDRRGFAEIHRVLRPGGRLVFTVPLTGNAATIERAKVVKGNIEHLLAPEYHGDVVRGQGKVLCFRDYRLDILDRLQEAGFFNVRFVEPHHSAWWGLGVRVIVAEK